MNAIQTASNPFDCMCIGDLQNRQILRLNVLYLDRVIKGVNFRNWSRENPGTQKASYTGVQEETKDWHPNHWLLQLGNNQGNRSPGLYQQAIVTIIAPSFQPRTNRNNYNFFLSFSQTLLLIAEALVLQKLPDDYHRSRPSPVTYRHLLMMHGAFSEYIYISDLKIFQME